MRINTNMEALNAQRNLGLAASTFAKSVEKLSSGLRINRAADDAAGLGISEKLNAQVTGLNQAQRNAQDGISMVQTAEGALTEVHSMLQRVRELAVEAANSTVGTADAASINAEVTSLQAEINRIALKTTFNGQNLLTGALSVAQSGGTAMVGTALSTGHTATISAVDVSGARANASYTLTSQSGGKLTLSDRLGNSQQVALTPVGLTGQETISFGSLGVKITVVGDSAKSATELATDLGQTTSTLASTIAGSSGTDLVTGDVLGTPVLLTGVHYYPSGAINAPAPTAFASAGVTPGTITFAADPSGHITGTLGGEAFAGDLAPFQRGHSDSIVLTGSLGNTITLTYHQSASAGILADEATDFDGSQVTFAPGLGTATVSAMTSAPATGGGTYRFTSGGGNSLTLTGPDGVATIGVSNIAANGTETLTFGNIGFTLTAGANGMTAAAIVACLTQPANDTIVVNSTGSAGVPRTLTTAASTAATFQIGANEGDTLQVGFANAQTAAYAGFDASIAAFAGAMTTVNAGKLISAADAAIADVSEIRGGFGAVENRLSHTVASISVASENLNASESRIKDLDVASEMVNFTKTQILQQAGTSILAQANSAPQSILTLLR
ncbi:MAG TPA: flagellin [Candidatus Limnocylindrales bacterium]